MQKWTKNFAHCPQDHCKPGQQSRETEKETQGTNKENVNFAQKKMTRKKESCKKLSCRWLLWDWYTKNICKKLIFYSASIVAFAFGLHLQPGLIRLPEPDKQLQRCHLRTVAPGSCHLPPLRGVVWPLPCRIAELQRVVMGLERIKFNFSWIAQFFTSHGKC